MTKIPVHQVFTKGWQACGSVDRRAAWLHRAWGWDSGRFGIGEARRRVGDRGRPAGATTGLPRCSPPRKPPAVRDEVRHLESAVRAPTGCHCLGPGCHAEIVQLTPPDQRHGAESGYGSTPTAAELRRNRRSRAFIFARRVACLTSAPHAFLAGRERDLNKISAVLLSC